MLDIAQRSPARRAPTTFSHSRQHPGADNLTSLTGFDFRVAVSRGHQAVAKRLALSVQHAVCFLDDVLGVAPSLGLRVLDRDDWRRLAKIPAYGIPHVADDGHIVVGTEAADDWQTVSEYFGRHLSARDLATLVAVHGVDPRSRRGPALQRFAETLIIREVARALTVQERLQFRTRWLADTFANYVLVAALGDREEGDLRLVGSMADAAATLEARMPTLATFEFGEVDVVETVLAELAITRSVYAAYALHDTAPLQKLFDAFRGSRRPRDADFELGRMLAIDVHPTIAAIPARFLRASLRHAA
jgi:hypothetical protein